jgi:hypothetical protein
MLSIDFEQVFVFEFTHFGSVESGSQQKPLVDVPIFEFSMQNIFEVSSAQE